MNVRDVFGLNPFRAIPIQAQPLQVVTREVAKRAATSIDVQVFLPQQQLAACVSRLPPGQQETSRVTQVEWSGWARSEPPHEWTLRYLLSAFELAINGDHDGFPRREAGACLQRSTPI